jgi:hypothetical protein
MCECSFGLYRTLNGARLSIGQRRESIHIESLHDESENEQRVAGQQRVPNIETPLSDIITSGQGGDNVAENRWNDGLYEVLYASAIYSNPAPPPPASPQGVPEDWREADQFFADAEPENQSDKPKPKPDDPVHSAPPPPRDSASHLIGPGVPMLASGRNAVPQPQPQLQLQPLVVPTSPLDTAPRPTASPSLEASTLCPIYWAASPRGTGGPPCSQPAPNPCGLQMSKHGEHAQYRPEMQRKAGKPSWEQVHHTTRAREAGRDAVSSRGECSGFGSRWMYGEKGEGIRFT